MMHSPMQCSLHTATRRFAHAPLPSRVRVTLQLAYRLQPQLSAIQGFEQQQGTENNAEFVAAAASSSSSSSSSAPSPSFTHSRLSCIADLPSSTCADWSDCDLILAANSRSVTADERGLLRVQVAA